MFATDNTYTHITRRPTNHMDEKVSACDNDRPRPQINKHGRHAGTTNATLWFFSLETLIIALAATTTTTNMFRKQKGERFKFVTSPNTAFISIDLMGFQERHSHFHEGKHLWMESLRLPQKVYFVNNGS